MSQTFKSWQDWVGSGSPPQTGTGTLAQQMNQARSSALASAPSPGFSSWQDWTNSGAAPAVTDTSSVWEKLRLTPSRLPDDHQRRMQLAANFAPNTPAQLMAMVDTAVVGFPTFGESRWSYPGRDMLQELIKYPGANLDAALPGAIRQVAVDMGEEPSLVESRLLTLGLSTKEGEAQSAISGRVFTDILGFQAADQALPIARQGALMAVQRLQGTYNPDTFTEDLDEMEQRIAADGNQRALEMTATLGLYILPFGPKSGPLKILSGRPQTGVGAAPLQNPNLFGGIEAVRFLGRVAEEGVGGAVVGELQDMGTAINPFVEDLAPSERVARTVLAAMAVAGLTSGAADVRSVAGELTSEIAMRIPGQTGQAVQRRLRPSALTNAMREAMATAEINPGPQQSLVLSRQADTPMLAFDQLTPAEHGRLVRAFDDAIHDMPARDLVAWGQLGQKFEAMPARDLAAIEMATSADGQPMTLADAAADAERRLAESGLAANEEYIHLDELKAKTAHLPRLRFAREVTSMEGMRQALVDSWGLGAKEAKAAAALMDARAQAWAEETGRPVAEWYQTRIASVGKMGDVAGREDGLLTVGGTVRFEYEGQTYQGTVAEGYSMPLAQTGRIPVKLEDGSTWTMPLSTFTDGIPQAVRERYAEISTSRLLYQEADGPQLLATHSTSVEGLQAALDLGGWPAPSVAITPSNMVPKAFGKVAVLFDSETVDPLSDYRNKVYPGDAYSVRQPKPTYRLQQRRLEQIEKNLAKWGGDNDLLRQYKRAKSWGNPMEQLASIVSMDQRWQREYLHAREGFAFEEIKALPFEELRSLFWGDDMEIRRELMAEWIQETLKTATNGVPYVKQGNKWVPYDLDSVAAAMAKKAGTAQEETLSYSLAKGRAASLKPATDIDGLRAQRDSLAPRDEAQRIYRQLDAEFNQFAWAIDHGNNLHQTGRRLSIQEEDNLRKALGYVMKGASPEAAMRRAGMGEYIVPDAMPMLAELARKVKNAPVEYFEAKPYRPVKLDEVRAVVAPNDMAPELLQRLDEQGVKVYQYDPADEASRVKAMTQAAEETGVLFQREQTAKAQIQFDRTGKAVLRALKDPDVSSAIHEFAHILRRDAYRDGGVTEAEQLALEMWAGVKEGKWTVAAEEKFARAFERYVRDGKAPTKELRGLFQRLKNMLVKVYETVAGSAIDVEISPDVREVFDNLLGKRAGEERARRAAAEQAAEEALVRQRNELLSVMDDDPRLDVFDDLYDDNLAQAIMREFGAGSDDPRDVQRVLRDAQDAATYADYQRQHAEDYATGFYREAEEQKIFGASGTGPRWYRDGNKWRSDARPSQIITYLDPRQMRPDIVEAVTDWVARFYNDPEYYVDKDNPSGKGQPVRPRRLSEIVAEGEAIPTPVYNEWLESVRPPDYDEPLYQDAGQAEGTILVDGKERPRANSNGRPIHPTEEGVRAFWQWFGDSKAVDEQGRPLVVYHGSPAVFAQFEEQPNGYGISQGKAFYFTDDPTTAAGYAENGFAPTRGGNIYPVYLRIENPKWIGAEGRSFRNINGGTRKRTWEDDPSNTAVKPQPGVPYQSIEDVRQEAQVKGHDGIIVTQVLDAANDETYQQQQAKGGVTTVAVFEPTQIKSATGNRGTFDPNEPSILYQDGPSEKDLALVAAKRLAEGAAQETVERMLVRDFKQKPGRASVIYRRALETLAMPDVERVYRETASRTAVAQMLAEAHPLVPKSRYAGLIRDTLAAVGENDLAGVRQAADEAFSRTVPDRATPVAEALLRMDKAGADQLLQDAQLSGRQRQLVLSEARRQVASTVVMNEWAAMPDLDHLAGLLMKRLDVKEPTAMELTRKALDANGIDYEAELRRQTQRWLETELEPAVEMTWRLMEQGATFEDAFSTSQFGRAARKTSVRARIREREAWPRIVQVFEETSSYGLVREMLREEFPEVPELRYREAFGQALASAGMEVAQAPMRRVDPKTKRADVVEGEDGQPRMRVVIGANEIVVPQSVVKDMADWRSRHPGLGSFWDEARYVEHMTQRNETAYRWLVEHREAAVTAYTKDQVRWRDELKAVYGKHLNNKEFRRLVMDWAENKMERGDGLLTEGVYFGDRLLEDVRTLIKNQHPDLWKDVERVAEWHRANYELLLDRQNDVRRAYGMGEIPRRADYMAHIQEEATALQKILQMQDDAGGWIPVGARRNTPYNQHAKQRRGQRSRRDSLANTEDYIDSALRTIHFTAPAIRRRTLAKVLQENDLAGTYGDIVQYWHNQANELVGQPIEGADGVQRILNGKVGRGLLEAVRFVSKRTALNGLVGNLRTAVMQTGSIPQVVALVGTKNLSAAALMRMHVARGLVPDPVEASAWMARRYEYKGRLARTGWDRAIEVGAKPMEVIEKAVAEIVWTSFHVQAHRAGRPFDAAVKYADKMTNRALAGRAIGEKPVIFNTDYGKVLLQFQLEVNNMVMLARHDATWNELLGQRATAAERWQRAAVYTVAAYVANSLYYEAFSDRPLPDPIDLSLDLAGIAADSKQQPTKERMGKLVGRVVGEVVSSLPGGTMAVGVVADENAEIFGTGMTREELLGRTPAGMYAGTLPTSSALRNATKGSNMAELGWNLTTTLGLPFGGRQLNKTATGMEALANGGTVTDRQGRERYTIDGLVEEARALLFGPNATKAAQDYWMKK